MSFSIQKLDVSNYCFVNKFKVNSESCENPKHYEDYLKQNAITDFKQGIGTTHVFIDEAQQNIMGYFTLKSSSLVKNMGEEHNFGYPAIEIAELAVHKDYERKGIGTDMLDFVFSKINEIKEIMAVQYVLLCADPKAEEFYSKSKFKFQRVRDFEQIPREHWNLRCVPMFVKLKET